MENNKLDQKKNKDVYIVDYISPRAIGRDGLDSYKEAVKNLAKESVVVAPEGKIVTFLFTKEDKFGKFEKGIHNMSLIKRIYNDRTFMHNPELASEFAEIMTLLNKASNIINKRKAKARK